MNLTTCKLVPKTAMATRVLASVCIAALASCSTPKPPTPPAADESTRRPVNDARMIEMLRLQSQVHNLELQMGAQAQQRQADALVASARAARDALTAQPAAMAPKAANQVFVVPYGFGKTDVKLDSAELGKLVESAKSAALVFVRGRTDGSLDSAVEARVARDRAAGMRAFLVGSGIDASKIRVTYQPTGDHLSENASSSGRDLNRRVEVEVYAVKPVVSMLRGPNSSQ
jgi:outer membrane protein OmpA-like peptidoglycan-associated protein